MRLGPVQSLTTALCMLLLFPGGLQLCTHADCFVVRIAVPPEDLKQPAVVAESVASEWTSTIGLRSPRSWTRVRMDVAPEGPKQPPAVADSMASEWTSSIGLRSPHGWTRFRMAVAPEGLKQLLAGTESVASELHCPPRQLWDHLVQLDRTWQLCRAWQILWLLHVVWIALCRWRNAKRPQGQVSNRDQPHRKGRGCGEQGTTPALAKKACSLNPKPSAGKEASAGPKSSSASSPGTRQAAGRKPSSSPQHNTGPARGFLSPTCRPEQSCEAGVLPEEAKPSRTLLGPPGPHLLHCAPVSLISREVDRRPQLPWGRAAWESTPSPTTNCSA